MPTVGCFFFVYLVLYIHSLKYTHKKYMCVETVVVCFIYSAHLLDINKTRMSTTHLYSSIKTALELVNVICSSTGTTVSKAFFFLLVYNPLLTLPVWYYELNLCLWY